MRDRFEAVLGYATFIIIVWVLIAFISSFAHTAPRKPVAGVHYFYGDVDHNSYLDLKDSFRRAEKAKLGELTIYIDSPGGYLSAAESMIRLMGKTRLTTKCIVKNLAASAAFLVFINCDLRIMEKKSSLMWHQVRTSVPGYVDSFTLRYFADELENIMMYYALLISIKSDYTIEEIESNVRYIDWYIFPKEALKRQLIHKVIK